MQSLFSDLEKQEKSKVQENCKDVQSSSFPTVGSKPASWPKTEILIASAPLDSKKGLFGGAMTKEGNQTIWKIIGPVCSPFRSRQTRKE